MSDSARLEFEAFEELETLVRRLSAELATVRRRAQSAVSRLAVLGGHGESGDGLLLHERITELERENADLRARLETASAQTRGMLERVHFLRQQVQSNGSGR